MTGSDVDIDDDGRPSLLTPAELALDGGRLPIDGDTK